MPQWVFEEFNVREDVKLNLPDDWKVRVFRVVSGDSGKKYWVQVVSHEVQGKLGKRYDRSFLCNCNDGWFKVPLLILGLQDFTCKHGVQLSAFLQSEKK